MTDNPQSSHARRILCIYCDLSEFLEQTRPPDPELVDLIEQAFLDGQIDSQEGELAYPWLMGKIHTQKRAQTLLGLFTDYLLDKGNSILVLP